MKRTLVAVLTITVLTAGFSFSEEGRMYEMMHRQEGAKADELADAAKVENRDKALIALSELITSCNACHMKFRH